MKIFLVTLSLAFLVLCPWAAHADISGSYWLSGYDAENDTTYDGEVEVNNEGTHVYFVDWYLSGDTYQGVGVKSGNVLGVGWGLEGEYGVIVYEVHENGRLFGEWLRDSTESELGYEVLQGPPGLNGTYEILEGGYPDSGDQYTGTVEIHPAGEVYRISWSVGGVMVTGVAILKGKRLIAAWGAGVAVYGPSPDGLTGVWAQVGATHVGTESLVRK